LCVDSPLFKPSKHIFQERHSEVGRGYKTGTYGGKNILTTKIKIGHLQLDETPSKI
jgi:hypothetical protein